MKKLAHAEHSSPKREKPRSGIVKTSDAVSQKRDFARELLQETQQQGDIDKAKLSRLFNMHRESDTLVRISLVETASFLIMKNKHSDRLVPAIAEFLTSTLLSERQHAMRAIAHYATKGGDISGYARIIASERLLDIHADVRVAASQALQAHINERNAAEVLGHLPEKSTFVDSRELDTIRRICNRFVAG